MKAPATQLYWKDWCSDTALRRCSWAAQGALPHVLLLLHNSDEYGVLRWPLAEIARTAHVPLKLLRELAAKNVLKGADSYSDQFAYAPRHAGKEGDPVVLVQGNGGSCWFHARFVRDNWVRQRRGTGTRFTSEQQPGRPPTRRIGYPQGDGPAFASAFASSSDRYASTEVSEGAAPDHACALRSMGYPDCSDQHPDLVIAKAEGITPQELIEAAKDKPGKGIGYLVQRARGRRADARDRANASGTPVNVVPIDPAAKAAAEELRRIDDGIFKANNDFSLMLITEEERDKRIAELQQEARALKSATGGRS